MSGEKKSEDYTTPVFHTQGGGLARRAHPGSDIFYFVEAPDRGTGLSVGDRVPDEWGLAPANDLARQEDDQPDGFL